MYFKPKGIKRVIKMVVPNFRIYLSRYVITGGTAKFEGILWIWRAVTVGRRVVTEFNCGNFMKNAINSKAMK
jgi:hypothetical protein